MLLSERSHSEKATYCMIPTIKHSGKGKTIETVKVSVIDRDWGRVGRDAEAEHRGFLVKQNYSV